MCQGSGVAVKCGVSHRLGSDLVLLWLWRRPTGAAPIPPLAWEPLYAVGVALKKKKVTMWPWANPFSFLVDSFFFNLWKGIWGSLTKNCERVPNLFKSQGNCYLGTVLGRGSTDTLSSLRQLMIQVCPGPRGFSGHETIRPKPEIALSKRGWSVTTTMAASGHTWLLSTCKVAHPN